MNTRFMLAVLMCTTLAACGGATQFDGSNPNDQGAVQAGQDQSSSLEPLPSSTNSSATQKTDSEDDEDEDGGSTGGLSSSAVSSSSAASLPTSSSTNSSPTNSSAISSSSISSSVVSSSAVSSSASSAPLPSGLSCQTPPGKSHNAGQNCLSCHKKGGSGSSYAVFTLAGTAYTAAGKAQANAIIKIYDHNSNTVALCIKTNNLGNFYTTQAIAGLTSPGKDAVAESPGGAIHTMSSTLTSGACNACHGVTVAKITAD